MTTAVREDRETYTRSVEVDGILSETGFVMTYYDNGTVDWATVGEIYRQPMAGIKNDEPSCSNIEYDHDHDGCIRDGMIVEWDEVEQHGEDVLL